MPGKENSNSGSENNFNEKSPEIIKMDNLTDQILNNMIESENVSSQQELQEKFDKKNATSEEVKKDSVASAKERIKNNGRIINIDVNKLVSDETLRVTKYLNGKPELLLEGPLEQVIKAYREFDQLMV